MPPIETTTTLLILTGILGYLLGSIPFGMVLAKVMNLGNLRDIGSGNIGATNVLRTGNKKAAALTLLLDGGKGAVAVLLGRVLLGEDAAQIGGFAAFLGHCFPIYLGFKVHVKIDEKLFRKGICIMTLLSGVVFLLK